MKLSKIRISDILFKANSKDLEKIVFKKKHKYKKAKCDIGLLLGGKSMIPYRVNECIDLFNQGIIDKILISGGIGYTNIDRKHPEAYKLRDILISNGIPPESIIIEDQSKSTIQNIEYSIDKLSEMFDLDKISIALITSDFHIKRCISLIRKKLNTNYLLECPVYDGKTDIHTWNNSILTRQTIIKEAINLVLLAKKGLIEDRDIKGLSYIKKSSK